MSRTEPTPPTVRGTTPAGLTDPKQAAQAVREMFTAIAPRYDLLNHLLSFNVDKLWWRRTARAFREVLERPGARALDLCCGTADMTLALRRHARPATPAIVGVDFSHAMLQLAARKGKGKGLGFCEADALQLPFPSAHFGAPVHGGTHELRTRPAQQ